jgi:hypothetical protein
MNFKFVEEHTHRMYTETGHGFISEIDMYCLNQSWKEFFKCILKEYTYRYRGISILSAILKLLEKMVCDRITPVVRPVISNAQHGFVKGRSTVNNLVQLTNGVIGDLEDGWQVDGMYTDFSKDFARVLHGLLSILFGRMLLCWMSSYLTGRTQRVKLEDYLSESIQCHCKVLQGRTYHYPLRSNILHFGY